MFNSVYILFGISFVGSSPFLASIKCVCSGIITSKNVCQTPFIIKENPRVHMKLVSNGISYVGSRPFFEVTCGALAPKVTH